MVEKIENAETALAKMKLNHQITPLENPSQIKAARRDIARMKTELSQRETLINNNGPDGNKKFKKSKTGCRYQQQNG